MQIANDFKNYLLNPLGEWKKLSKDPREHVGPLVTLGSATLLVMAVSKKHFASGFVIISIFTYPFFHHQIVYFMSVDVHEDVKAITIVAIYIFSMYYPPLAAWGLPPLLAIVYSNRAAWAKQRQLQLQLNQSLVDLGASNQKLRQTNDELAQKSIAVIEAHTQLDKAQATTTAITGQFQKAFDVHQVQVTAIEARNAEIMKRMETIIQLFNTAKSTELGDLLVLVDAARRELSAAKRESNLIMGQISASSQRYEQLVQEGTEKEKAFQETLGQLVTAFSSLKPDSFK
jgi:hypothetical protein